jgi:probable rRNA maturation factor
MSAINFIKKGTEPSSKEYSRLRRIIGATLKNEVLDPHSCELTIVFSTDEELQQLNETYRHISRATDVLSFPADDLDPESGRKYLGDIVISMDQVNNQHQKYGDQNFDILCLLIVHGILHLLGLDHANKAEKKVMWEKQTQILDRFGIVVHILDD